MLRSSSKIKMFGALVSFAAMPLICALSASATTVTNNTNFQVNVGDALTVSVTTPDTWAVGDPGVFLRNRIVVSANTNNPSGLTIFMNTKTANTDLVNKKNSSYFIETVDNDYQVQNFPANYWGYTLDDDVAAPRNSAEYSALVGAGESPITIWHSTAAGATGDKNVFFGAKTCSIEDAELNNCVMKPSGTYASTVVISVVTGVIEDDPEEPGYNPSTPVDPATPTPPNVPTYNPTNNTTTYTTVTPNNNTTTTTTEVTPGNVTSTYQNPQGVKHTTTNVEEGNPLAIGLATASAVAGATGFIFFIVGKRRKDEDEEEENAGGQQPPIQQ